MQVVLIGKTMVQLAGVYLEPVQNGSLEKFDNWWTLMGCHLARDIIETFSKRPYFSVKYIFPNICHKIGIAIKN